MKLIHVFKTNISGRGDLEKMAAVFEQESQVELWSVDLNDTDKVMRVEASGIQAEDLQKLTTDAGFLCEELTA